MNYTALIVGLIIGFLAYFVSGLVGIIAPWTVVIGIVVGEVVACYGDGIYNGHR